MADQLCPRGPGTAHSHYLEIFSEEVRDGQGEYIGSGSREEAGFRFSFLILH